MHDPLFARALVLEGGGEKIALVSADLVVITHALHKEVKRRTTSFSLLLIITPVLAATGTISSLSGFHG